MAAVGKPRMMKKTRRNNSALKSPRNGQASWMHYLENPILNKGTAFTENERTKLQLHGLLPAHVQTLEKQVVRTYGAYLRKQDDLERHIYLRGLQDRNEVLFYRLLQEHIEEMLPVLYTPVVAQGCANFSRIYRRPRGLFISYPKRKQMVQMLRNRPYKDIDVIVVTDGERVLGIGDQGVGGLGISIGKLSLYSLIGGIHPARTLPVVLDVGTNNQKHLLDPAYLGWQHARITGNAYDAFVDQFVRAVKSELPNTLLQWEDFGGEHARPLLERYRNQLCTFNDDIQGTAAVTLGALLSACKISKQLLKDQRIVFFGAGSAAVGVADYIRLALEAEGISKTASTANIWMIDSHGLLVDTRTDLKPAQKFYAKSMHQIHPWKTRSNQPIGLFDVVKNVKATVLIGLSTVSRAFNEDVVRTMAKYCDFPIIFPLSNPTDRAEASPDDLMQWTDGHALIATGSPFPPVQRFGKSFPVAQCNNVYIFPAVGLATTSVGAKRITDGMMLAAAYALAENSPTHMGSGDALLPELANLRNVAVKIAIAVAQQAMKEGQAKTLPMEKLRQQLKKNHWTPTYTRIG